MPSRMNLSLYVSPLSVSSSLSDTHSLGDHLSLRHQTQPMGITVLEVTNARSISL